MPETQSPTPQARPKLRPGVYTKLTTEQREAYLAAKRAIKQHDDADDELDRIERDYGAKAGDPQLANMRKLQIEKRPALMREIELVVFQCNQAHRG